MATNAIDLANTISAVLAEYGNEIGEIMDEVSYESAKEGVSLLKQTSPELTGSYRKGWRLKRDLERKGRIRSSSTYTIYNKTDYQLTHLLEKGHAKVDGTGRVDAKPHIEPVEEKLAREIEQKLAQAVGRR